MEARPAVAILLAAGAGERLGADEPKAFLAVGDRPLLELAARAAAAAPGVHGLVVAFPDGWEGRARACVDPIDFGATFVIGGASRQASVRAALAAVPERTGVVVVHDAARPFASPDLFERVIRAVVDGADGAIPVLPVPDTIVRVRRSRVAGTEPRDELALAQTPQAFRAAVLREVHEKADAAGLTFTDDASILAWAGFEVRTVPGDTTNGKITTLADLAEADRRIRAGDG
jgi:2-C-methyl-D-erythritol 4-phosphate cytidylyltransferase